MANHPDSGPAGPNDTSTSSQRRDSTPSLARHRERLRRYLDASDAPETPTYHEAWGYMFGVACGPEALITEEWLPGLFDLDWPKFATAEEEAKVTGAFAAIYSFLSELGNDVVFLPQDVEVHPDDPRLLHEWSRGFESGREWVIDAWNDALELLPEIAREDHDPTVALLGLWSTLDAGAGLPSLEELPKEIAAAAGYMSGALTTYARIGKAGFRRLNQLDEWSTDEMPDEQEIDAMEQASSPLRTAPVVGRNEPCPCGSGKKFKRCCLHQEEAPGPLNDWDARLPAVISPGAHPSHAAPTRTPAPPPAEAPPRPADPADRRA